MYEELKKLSKAIQIYDDVYYNRDNNDDVSFPTISDEEFDALAQREAEICEQNPGLLLKLEQETGLGHRATRFGGRVGPIINETVDDDSTSKSGLDKVEHMAMLSLDNAMDEVAVEQWIGRVRKLLLSHSLDSTGSVNEGFQATAVDGELSADTTLQILVEPKMDGLSLSLRYCYNASEDRDKAYVVYNLEWAATRGNGKIGEDVTEAVLDMNAVPRNISIPLDVEYDDNIPDFFEVRGEVILPRVVFEDLQRASSLDKPNMSANATNRVTDAQRTTTGGIFRNARNAASGILRRTKSLDEDSLRLRSSLKFYAYDVVSSNENNLFGISADDMRQKLEKLNFDLPQPSDLISIPLNKTSDGIDTLLQYHKSLDSARASLMFDIDGAVYKLNHLDERNKCGSSTRAPRWALAHKFTAQSAITKILDVTVQVGRTGSLTPVAVLKPVTIGGASVSRATLHNFLFASSILSNGIENRTLKGTNVVVARAGDVIPQILRKVDALNAVKENERTTNDWISLESPKLCPSCGSMAMFDGENDNSTVTGQVLRCTGPPLLCKPRAVSGLAHAFSRDALNVAGLSEARITQLMDAGILTTPSDIFAIDGDGT